MAEEPARKSEPPDTVTCPVVAPFRAPARVMAPLPDTASRPPSVVVPSTVTEPPETFRELPLLMASVPTVSVPLPWATA